MRPSLIVSKISYLKHLIFEEILHCLIHNVWGVKGRNCFANNLEALLLVARSMIRVNHWLRSIKRIPFYGSKRWLALTMLRATWALAIPVKSVEIFHSRQHLFY